MKVQDLSIEELKNIVGEAVEERLRNILNDPDWGLQLKDELKNRLKCSLEETKKGAPGIPLNEAAERLGL